MKKLILPIIVFILFFMVFSSSVYAQPEETTSSTKPSSGYDPKCWNTHMVDQMAVCSKTHTHCLNKCTPLDSGKRVPCFNECSKALTACYKKSTADYKVCIEAEKQAQKQQDTKELESKVTQAPSKDNQGDQPQPDQTEKTATQNKSSEAANPFNIFGINPYETWLNIQGLLYFVSPQILEDSEIFALNITGNAAALERMEKDLALKKGEEDTSKPDEQDQTNTSEVSSQELKDLGAYASVDELLNRPPELTEEIVEKAKADWEQMVNPNTNDTTSPYRLDILNGQIQIKLPGQNEWSDLKQGDIIPSGSTIFTGMDTTTVLTIAGKGVVQVQSFTEITISEKGLEQAAEAGQTFTEIDLKTGEIEVNIESGVFTAPILQVNTPSVVAGVRGTHFWVSYVKDNNLSTVGVYEGQVEVKAKGSNQTTLVSPNGDKPGVVVVAQKLSIWKLIMAGVVLVVIIGGVFLLLKRRGNTPIRVKKRK